MELQLNDMDDQHKRLQHANFKAVYILEYVKEVEEEEAQIVMRAHEA